VGTGFVGAGLVRARLAGAGLVDRRADVSAAGPGLCVLATAGAGAGTATTGSGTAEERDSRGVSRSVFLSRRQTRVGVRRRRRRLDGIASIIMSWACARLVAEEDRRTVGNFIIPTIARGPASGGKRVCRWVYAFVHGGVFLDRCGGNRESQSQDGAVDG